MQITTLAAGCAAVLALSAPALAKHAAMGPTVFPITAQNGSGETGTVTLTPTGTDETTVAVDLTGAGADAEPAHIHQGSCAKLNPAPKYPLTSLSNGKSTTLVKAPMRTLTAGGFAVNVHKSASDLKDYVACGNLDEANVPAPKGGATASTAAPAPSAAPVKM